MMVLLRLILGAFLGTIPGILTGLLWSPRIGVAVAGLGAIVGLLLNLPGVSSGRVMRLFAVVMITRNIPFVGQVIDWFHPYIDRLYQSVDTDESDRLLTAESNPVAHDFTGWIMGADVTHRRGWVVLIGLVAGLTGGIVIATRDNMAIQNNQPGYLLPLPGSRESLLKQGCVLSVACAIWMGSIFSLFASAVYRRPIIFGALFAIVLSSLIGISVDDGSGKTPIGMAVFFGTGAMGAGMFFASSVTSNVSDDPESDPAASHPV